MQQLAVFHTMSFVGGGENTQQDVQLLVLLLVVTLIVALISRPLRLPYTLVLVVVGLIIGISSLLPTLRLNPDIVLFLFLPVLLFEGAWSVDVKLLTSNWLIVLLLAVPGLLLSVLIVAALLHWTLGLPWLMVLLLGAMISPTDPVAVLALLRQMSLSDRLRTIVEGESLLNDGVGAAIFTLVLGLQLVSPGGTETRPCRVLCNRFLEPPVKRLQKSITQNSAWSRHVRFCVLVPEYMAGGRCQYRHNWLFVAIPLSIHREGCLLSIVNFSSSTLQKRLFRTFRAQLEYMNDERSHDKASEATSPSRGVNDTS